LGRWQTDEREKMKDRLRAVRMETGFEDEDEELEEDEEDEDMEEGDGFEGAAVAQ